MVLSGLTGSYGMLSPCKYLSTTASSADPRSQNETKLLDAMLRETLLYGEDQFQALRMLFAWFLCFIAIRTHVSRQECLIMEECECGVLARIMLRCVTGRTASACLNFPTPPG